MLAFQNMAKIYYYICIWAVCLLAACSAGDEATSFPGQADAENRVGVTLQLSALSSQTSQSSRSSLTRAGWDTDNEAWPGEMMKSWFVVVVQNGMIEKIITSDLKSDVTEVEKDQVFVELKKGETTFYSFANIKPEEIGLNASTSVGQPLPADFDEKTYRMDGNSKLFHLSMTSDFQNGYPMSNKQTVDVVDNQQVINLEVIRMVAKVQLSITNATDHVIVLKSITLSDVTLNGNRNIKLLPNVDSANKLKGVNLADGVAKGTITLKADENNKGITIGEGAKQTACFFYMNESLVDKGEDGGNRYFILSLTTVDATTGTTSNQRYAMLSWNEIRRNDYLKIPIKLEDYQIRWTVEAFSPIGVLPKVKDDGKNLSLDFGYYGEFHIKPEVIKLSRTGSQTLSVSEWQMGTDATGSDGWTRKEQNPEGADGVNIFDSSPAWVPSAYRLEGEMGNRTGSAIYTMKIKVKEQNGLGAYPIISRKVRFTMKQIDLTRAGKNTEKIVLNTKTFSNEGI